MTLLVDRLRANRQWQRLYDGTPNEQVVSWMLRESVPVYEISNVSRYLSEFGGDLTELTHFPNVAPPHTLYWFEWALPPLWRRDSTQRPPERVALLIWQEEAPADGVWKVHGHAFGLGAEGAGGDQLTNAGCEVYLWKPSDWMDGEITRILDSRASEHVHDAARSAWVPDLGDIVRDGKVDADVVRRLYRAAAPSFHPDAGGSNEAMKRIVEARDVLLG